MDGHRSRRRRTYLELGIWALVAVGVPAVLWVLASPGEGSFTVFVITVPLAVFFGLRLLLWGVATGHRSWRLLCSGIGTMVLAVIFLILEEPGAEVLGVVGGWLTLAGAVVRTRQTLGSEEGGPITAGHAGAILGFPTV